MASSLLVESYDRLPPLQPGDDEELWAAGVQDGMKHFRKLVSTRYTEGTLQRLLRDDDVKARRAAVLALGLVGTIQSNAAVAAALRDDDPLVQRFASDALWELWFRGGTTEQNFQLQQAARKMDSRPDAARSALDALIRSAPDFAEAYNQRAILAFRRNDWARSAEDCEAVLRLNPYHFGAAAGLGQSYMKLKKPRAALRAFEQAVEINPTLDHLRDTIQQLQEAIDNGPRDEG